MATFTVRVEPLGAQVDCRGDQTVLDACLRAGIWLPHACTHGTCGTCKAQVLGGAVEDGEASPFALLDSERAAGTTLLCVARPSSDLLVAAEVDSEEGIAVHPVRDFTATVAVLADVAPGVRRVVLDLDAALAFHAGQYVQLQVPGGPLRPYSVASPTSESRRIELHVRRRPGGVCTDGWLFGALEVGDTVGLSGPYGRFFWRPAREEPMLLLGAGTGLAPLKGIVREVLASGLPRRMTLYHGVAGVADLYDRDFFEQLEREHPGFTYRPALSREAWQGRTGRVPALLAADLPRAAGHVAYVCGSPAMVADTMKALMRARLFPRDIYREDFYDEADRARGAGAVRGPLIR